MLTLAGWLLMLVPPVYLVMTAIRRQPLRLGGFELPMPSPAIAAGQILLSSVEWSIAGAVLYVLLPPSALPFLQFLGMFLIAILLGMVSHVPGGLGVFEGLMVLLLKPYLSSAELLPALVVYRVVYYLLPLGLALIVLVGDEMRARRAHAARIGAVLGRVTEWLTPRALSAVTFLAGLVLLFSGATPAAAGRLVMLDRVLPIGVIEASHLLGSIAGVLLLILSQGLARRLDAAYYLTATTMIVGHGGVAAEGLRLRGSRPAARRLADLEARAAGVRSPRRVLRHAIFARLDRRGRRALSAHRSGSDSSRSSTSTTRVSSGGSSRSRAMRRDSCALRSAPPSCCCCSDSPG